MQKIKVLIGDNSMNMGVICAETLTKYGVEVSLAPKDGIHILEAINSTNPDIVVMNAYLARLDAISVVKRLEDGGIHPKIIVTSSYNNAFVEETLLSLGITYYMINPQSAGEVCDVVLQVAGIAAEKANAAAAVDLESVVTDIILELGMPANIKGYHYSRRAIMLCVENREMISMVTKMLYPTVAKEFKTTASRVERGIRHAIEVAWNRGNVEKLGEYFGYTISSGRGKPTNSEFIAMIADRLRLKLKNGAPMEKAAEVIASEKRTNDNIGQNKSWFSAHAAL